MADLLKHLKSALAGRYRMERERSRLGHRISTGHSACFRVLPAVSSRQRLSEIAVGVVHLKQEE